MAVTSLDGNLLGVLDAARKVSTSSTDQGQRFERLCRAALTAHNGRDGARRFKQVWLWNETWPHKKRYDNVDTGIDLVAEQIDGTFAAIQCKFHQGQISTSAVDSFLAASARPEFTARIIITTGSGFQRHGMTKLKHTEPRCEVFDTQRMSGWDINWWELSEQTHTVATGTPRRSHQTPQSRTIGFMVKARRRAGRYYASVRSRFSTAKQQTRPRRWLWRCGLVLESVVVTAVFVAVVAVTVFVVVVGLAAAFVVMMFTSSDGRKKRRRQRR